MSYSNIFEYLEDVNPELAEVYRENCLEWLFNPKSRAGVTLLMPTRTSNPEFWQSLVEETDGLDADKQSLITKQLTSLVIFDNLSSPDVFKSKADDIPNGNRQHIEVDLANSTSNTIRFKCGASATMDNNFRSACKKKNINVYILSDGGIPIDGPPAKFTHVSGYAGGRRRRQVDENETRRTSSVWGDDGETVNADSRLLRNRITQETENIYVMDQVQRTQAKKSKNVRNIYVVKVLSLINFILGNCSEQVIKDILISRMFPLLSFENIDFYFFVEPGKNTGKYLVPTDLIKRWYSAGSTTFDIPFVVKQIEELFNRGLVNAACISNRLALQDNIDSVTRETLINSSQGRELAGAVNAQYTLLIERNQIGNLGNVYPDEAIRYFRSVPERKIYQDELRYVSARIFADLESGVTFDRNQFESLRQIIERGMTDRLSVSALRLLNPNTLKFALDPVDKIKEIQAFINSLYFMFMPLTQADLVEFKKTYVCIDRPSPDGEGLWVPTDKRVAAAKSYDHANDFGDKVGYTDEATRALTILQNLKARGFTFDEKTRRAIGQMIDAGETAEAAVKSKLAEAQKAQQ